MSTNEKVLIAIEGDAKNFINSVSQFEQASGRLEKSTGILSKGFLAATAAITGLIVIAKKSIDAFIEQDKVTNRLKNSLSNLGISASSANKLFDQLQKKATDLQKVTTFGDEAIMNVQSYFMTIGVGTEQVDRYTKAALNLSAQTGKSLDESMKLVAKLAQGKGQRIKIELGLKEGTLEELEEKVNGAAERMAQTPAGQLEVLKNRLDDAFESLGGSLLPIVNKIFGAVIPIVENLITSLSPFIQSLLPMVVDLLNAIMPPIMELVNALLPPIQQILGILLPFISEIVQKLLPPLVKVLESILVPVLGLIANILPSILDVLTPIIDLVAEILGMLGELFSAILKPLMPLITDLVKALLPAIKPALESIAFVLKYTVGLFVEGVKWLMTFLGIANAGQAELGKGATGNVAAKAADAAKGKGAVSGLNIPYTPTTIEGGGKGKAEKSKPETENVFFQVESGLAYIDETLPKLEESFAKAEEKLKALEDNIKSFGNNVRNVFQSVFGDTLNVLLDETLGKLKIHITEDMPLLQKLGATLLNSIVEFGSRIITEALTYMGTLALMNAIVPGSGTSFAALTGGIGGQGGVLGTLANIIGFAKGSRASGGPVSEGMWNLHDNEYVLNANQTRNLGRMLDNMTNFMNRTASIPNINIPKDEIVIEGDSRDVIKGMVKIYRRAPKQTQREYGRTIAEAQGLA